MLFKVTRKVRSPCCSMPRGWADSETGTTGYSDAVHLVAVTRALDSVVSSRFAVPRDYCAVAGCGVEGFPVGAQREGCDWLVMPLHHHPHLAGVVQVEEVEKARERDRYKMRSRPETAHLLVLHSISHLECGEADAVADVPNLPM